MENYYRPPESDLIDAQNSGVVSGRLYKLPAVGIATFFGTLIAGGFILAQNFYRLGRPEAARASIILSILATTVVVASALFIPEDLPIPNAVFTIIQIVAIMQIARQQQGDIVQQHEEGGGAFESNWKAFGISLIFLAVFAGLFFLGFQFVFGW